METTQTVAATERAAARATLQVDREPPQGGAIPFGQDPDEPTEADNDNDGSNYQLDLLTKCLSSWNPDRQKKLLERYTAEVLPEEYKEAEVDKVVAQAVIALDEQIRGWTAEQIRELTADIRNGCLSPEPGSAVANEQPEANEQDDEFDFETQAVNFFRNLGDEAKTAVSAFAALMCVNGYTNCHIIDKIDDATGGDSIDVNDPTQRIPWMKGIAGIVSLLNRS